LLDGYDVVGMITDNQARKGDPKVRSVYKGVTLYFANAENKTKFETKPEAYLPQYGGYCSNGVVYGIPWGGDGDSFRVVNGKLYMFGGIGSKKAFELDIPGNIALADKYWANEIEGSNAFFQRSKRTTFSKVPHYKTGAELAAAVEAAEKKAK
jgi:YHS domain-containing protein